MLETLKHIDQQLFLLINGKHNPFFDFIMWWASNKWIWIPFYAVLAYLIAREYKWKSVFVFISIGVLAVLTDQISVLIKNSVQRFRPTHNPQIADLVHVLHHYRGGSYGFVSSHATSVFALAFIITFFLRKKYKYLPLIMFLWAFLVSYSRIYLGVHYPGDVTCGALLGLLLAFIITRSFLYIKPLQFKKYL